MKLFASVIAFLIIACGDAQVPQQEIQFYSFEEDFRILPINQKALYASWGVMNLLQQCGGQGQVTQWRHEACNATIPGPCAIPAGQFRRAEMSFIPRRDAASLGLIVSLHDPLRAGLQVAAYQVPNIDQSAVTAGKEYGLSNVVDHAPELKGQLITTHLTIYREVDQEVEVCAKVDYYIV